MKRINKVFKSLLALSLLAVISSCNNNSETTKEEAATTEDSIVTAPAEPEFKPFDVALVTHKVKDYAAWRPVFDADSAHRMEDGMETIAVARGVDDTSNIMMAFKVADIQKAKDFAADPKLKPIMEKAGVISKPNFEFLHVIRFNADSKEKQWVDVTHRVKDFDAWLKVFDEQGTVARANGGLYDVVMARGIEDSNMVHLVFDIRDMAKAKATMSSEELKQLMTRAGVEGTPKIEFYKEAQ